MKFTSNCFESIWAVDWEFHHNGNPGNRPTPVCCVAVELESGKRLKIWQDELIRMKNPPYDTGPDSLFIAHYASAEISCHLARGWSIPVNILDTFAEFRVLTNGKNQRASLIAALEYFGLSNIGALEKDIQRDRILSGGPWDLSEREEILKYCESDVLALIALFEKLWPTIDLPYALLRGRYMASCAQMENRGVPIDTERLNLLTENWEDIKLAIISEVDRDFGVYEDGHFRNKKFAEYLALRDIEWPRTPTGNLKTDADTFRNMSKVYPELIPLKELKFTIDQLKLKTLQVGDDRRNRCLISALGARTSRNTPSNSKFVFGPAVWMRGLIKPEPDTALAYVDWSQQEFGIAAALSGDLLMQKAYLSGDPYLEFAKQAGAVPPDASKESHPLERELYKMCVLGVGYGMGAQSLAVNIKQPVVLAQDLLDKHRDTYRQFWKWSGGARDYAMYYGKMWTTFGWTIREPFGNTGEPNPRSLRNFLIQANGAEMLRIAICFALERGVRVIAPIHDALLIESPLHALDENIKLCQEAMVEASKVVLNGFELRSDVKRIQHPDRYMDKRGEEMWDKVEDILLLHLCGPDQQIAL
jgi:hypothetical protein